ATRLEADEERAHPRIVLEVIDALLAVRGQAVEVLVDVTALIELPPEESDQRSELREDEHLVPFGVDLLEHREERLELARLQIGLAGVDERRVARGLTHAQERFEDVELRARHALRGDRGHDGRLEPIADLLVDLPLLGLHLAEDRLLDLLRQVGRDVLLLAPEDERTERTSKVAERRRRDVLSGSEALPERILAPEHAGIQEVEEAPKLDEVVLDRRAAQDQASLA